MLQQVDLKEGFINLDNSMFLKMVPFYKRFKWIFPKKYYSNFDEHWVTHYK